ncbi:hypothetical protein ACFY94_42130 [Streptomyces griseorubiginosus]|uniref:hypothetical protein n=1 Tax=Streptomyces griseorubiginosus TaxID=67304 RepID=UPI0036E0A164
MIGHEADAPEPSGQVVQPHEIVVPPDPTLRPGRPPTPVPQPPPPPRRPTPDTPTTSGAHARTDPLSVTGRKPRTRTGRREVTSHKACAGTHPLSFTSRKPRMETGPLGITGRKTRMETGPLTLTSRKPRMETGPPGITGRKTSTRSRPGELTGRKAPALAGNPPRGSRSGVVLPSTRPDRLRRAPVAPSSPALPCGAERSADGVTPCRHGRAFPPYARSCFRR